MDHQRVDRKRAGSYGWLILLLLITGCDPWDLTYSTLSNGLAAYYPFSGNMLDASGNQFNGSAISGAAFGKDRYGVEKSALLLNGISDYVEIKDDSRLHPNAISISVWINTKSVDSTCYIYSKTDWVTGKPQLYRAAIDPYCAQPDKQPIKRGCRLIADVNNSNLCKELVENKFDSPVVLDTLTYELNRWYHITTIFEGTIGQIYINGELKKIESNLPNFFYDCEGGKLRFGANYQGDPNYFCGMMDDIRVYNRALTQAEVKALYNL